MASHSPQRPRRLQTQQLNQGMSSFINITLSSLLERFFMHGLTSGTPSLRSTLNYLFSSLWHRLRIPTNHTFLSGTMPNLQPRDPSPSPSLRDRPRALKTQSMPLVPSIAALAAQQSSQTQQQPTSPTVSTNSNNRRSSPIGQVTRLLPYEASSSRKDVLNAHSFVAPVAPLYDLLYYRYGFSLRELPYTGVPSSLPSAGLPFCWGSKF